MGNVLVPGGSILASLYDYPKSFNEARLRVCISAENPCALISYNPIGLQLTSLVYAGNSSTLGMEFGIPMPMPSAGVSGTSYYSRVDFYKPA